MTVWTEAGCCRVSHSTGTCRAECACSGSRLSRSGEELHDVTIVDMGELSEVLVSIADLSRLREQWPPMVLRHMVWLQQDLDTTRAEARKRFRNARPGRCSYCDKMIKCDVYRHVSTYHLDLAQLWWCPYMVYSVEGYATGLHGSCSRGT